MFDKNPGPWIFDIIVLSIVLQHRVNLTPTPKTLDSVQGNSVTKSIGSSAFTHRMEGVVAKSRSWLK